MGKADHVQKLLAVLKKLEVAGTRLKSEKCKIAQNEIKSL